MSLSDITFVNFFESHTNDNFWTETSDEWKIKKKNSYNTTLYETSNVLFALVSYEKVVQ